MSHSTKTSVPSINFCDICDLEFETKKELYKHQSYDPKHKELLEKMFASDLRSSSTKLFDKFTDSDDGLLYVRPGTETGTKTDTKTETEPESEVPSENLGCWVCGNKFKNQIGLQTHMNKHWRENVSLDENYNIKSSFNQRQLYITKSNNSLIKDINEPVDYILDEYFQYN